MQAQIRLRLQILSCEMVSPAESLTERGREFCFDGRFFRGFRIFFLGQLAQQVLQDRAIAFPDFTEFDTKAEVKSCVPDLAFNTQIVIRYFQNELEISARQNGVFRGNEATGLGYILQGAVEIVCACAAAKEFDDTLGGKTR